ncbi:MAG TPA: hypothetical protein EYM84_02765 [Flavobacteriales bacterium]|nr:hypothetical protein [Flavobacteriales bacterium]HIN39176.1 hypothetical protein [Flavobacteriales bacterium]
MIFKKLKKSHLLLVLLAISLLPYIYLAFFAHPIADDLIYASKGEFSNILKLMMTEYMSWNGRYISNFFVLINPINHSLILYQLIPVGLIILIIIGAGVFFRCFFKEQNLKASSLLNINLLFTLILLGQLPTIAEGIYWYTGAITYIPPIAFTLLYFSLIYKYMNSKWLINKHAHFLGMIILLFFIIGFNEVHMLMLLLFHVTMFIIAKNTENKWLAGVLLITAIAFASIMVFSPGNAGREAHFENSHDLLKSITYALLQTIRFSAKWISYAPLLLLSILYIPFHFNLAKTSNLFQKSFWLKPYFSLMLLFSTVFLCAFALYWSTGSFGYRIMNTAWFFFLIMWFVNLSVWCNHFKSTLSNLTIPNNIQNIFFGIIWLTLTFTHNGYGAALDIFQGTAERFDQVMAERYMIMENAREAEENYIYFTPITDPPHTLFVLDITGNSNHWINIAYPLYFGMPEKHVISSGQQEY